MSMDRLRQAVEAADRRAYDPMLEPAIAAARSVLDAPRLWRCWENIVIGPPLQDADWTPHLQQPSYCKPENGHHGCGWVRLVDDPQGSEQ